MGEVVCYREEFGVATIVIGMAEALSINCCISIYMTLANDKRCFLVIRAAMATLHAAGRRRRRLARPNLLAFLFARLLLLLDVSNVFFSSLLIVFLPQFSCPNPKIPTHTLLFYAEMFNKKNFILMRGFIWRLLRALRRSSAAVFWHCSCKQANNENARLYTRRATRRFENARAAGVRVAARALICEARRLADRHAARPARVDLRHPFRVRRRRRGSRALASSVEEATRMVAAAVGARAASQIGVTIAQHGDESAAAVRRAN